MTPMDVKKKRGKVQTTLHVVILNVKVLLRKKTTAECLEMREPTTSLWIEGFESSARLEHLKKNWSLNDNRTCCYCSISCIAHSRSRDSTRVAKGEGTKGLRRKVLTGTKILSPNIRYFAAILRFVPIYALFGNILFFSSNTVFLGQEVHNILHIILS